MENRGKSSRRYEIKDKIGAGDFAVVHTARDTKLGRDVAVKQLHRQYLDDQEKLERYWLEAQLLVAVEHPNVMTIYDVIRSKGCLILELMKGSLKQIYAGRPMPVAEVREMIQQAARGLECLHAEGIIHGDIKPGNLFLSRQGIVKLGDFGLARRASDSDGSLVKGTTQYMAPELVSEEFGDVGPASDLYSLGFTALELLVGPDFESLFPDLIAFGRDRQMAWMMWHCSADRRLPPVQKLLEGVPDDLANVIGKLIQKRQQHRYKSAAEVIADLSGTTTTNVGQSLEEEAAAAAALARQKKKRRRKYAIAAFSTSLVLCLAYLFYPQAKPAPPPELPPAIYGVVQNIVADDKFVLDVGENWKEIKVVPQDTVTLNRKQRQLRDLQLGDRVTVYTRLTDDQKKIFEIVAFRPETHTGVVEKVSADGKLTLRVTEGSEADQEFVMNVPADTPVTLNKTSSNEQGPVTLTTLAEGDQAEVKLSDDEEGMLALKIDAIREMQLTGTLRKINAAEGKITVDVAATVGDENSAASRLVTLGVASDCAVWINGLTALNQKLIRLSDLQAGDQVEVKHDIRVTQISAQRILSGQGRITRIDFLNATFTVQLADQSSPVKFTVAADCEITLGGEEIDFQSLRAGDQVKLTHDSPDADTPALNNLEATRPSDPNKWAILIGNGVFDDPRVPRLPQVAANLALLQDSLQKRYAVPPTQTLVCENFDRVRLKQEIPNWLKRVASGHEVYVYLSSQVFDVAGDTMYLIPKDFAADKPGDTGIKLDWLIDELDQCQTKHKLLLLDCTHANSGAMTFAPIEIIDRLRANQRGGYPRSVFVLGSCSPGQHGLTSSSANELGLFAEVLAAGFRGAADLERDNQLVITELAEYVVKQAESKSRGGQALQIPQLILPNPTPPRISDQVKADLLELMSQFGKRNPDFSEVSAAASRISASSGGQPEPMLIYGLLLADDFKFDPALEVLEALAVKHPTSLPTLSAVTWLHFYKSRYDTGFEKLELLLAQVPPPDRVNNQYSPQWLHRFEWMGRLHELAARADWSRRQPSAEQLKKFSASIEQLGEKPVAAFQKGQSHVKKVLAEIEQEIVDDPNSQADLKRGRLRTFVDSIVNDSLIAEIREGLDK